MTTEEEEERDPTPDEIERVGRYWARVRLLACDHSGEITVDSVDGEGRVSCSQCDQPLRFMSEIQIEELRKGKQ